MSKLHALTPQWAHICRLTKTWTRWQADRKAFRQALSCNRKTAKHPKITNKLLQVYSNNVVVHENQQKQQIPVRKTCAAKLAMEYGVFRAVFKRESGSSQESWPKLPPENCFGVKSTNGKKNCDQNATMLPLAPKSLLIKFEKITLRNVIFYLFEFMAGKRSLRNVILLIRN